MSRNKGSTAASAGVPYGSKQGGWSCRRSIGRAGTPTTVVQAGTGSRTTAFAPTRALSPTVMGPNSDSLCCPSRASIFTGNFPHDTGVFQNTGPDGGFQVFYDRGEDSDTFATALQSAGYRTAMMGKFLNRYMQLPPSAGVPNTYVPPGWSEWDVAGWGYPEYGYTMNENGTLHQFGYQPWAYLTSVLAHKGVDFIGTSVQMHAPFMLELATFSPHAPYVPAPRDLDTFGAVQAPRPPNFNVIPTNAPRWLAAHTPLNQAQISQVDHVFRRRVESVQSVDRMIGALERALEANGVADNTYLVFSSDNGLHTGEFALMPGKLTAFDTDIRVPLVVVGPGVPAGVTTSAVAENIDLAPTFAAIGGTGLPSDGHSLLPVLYGDGSTPAGWRDVALIEHHGPDLSGSDPDYQQPASGNPRTYEALRSERYLYVEYNDGEIEAYDLQNDPFELHNIATQLPPGTLAQLHAQLLAMESCHTGPACWTAMGGSSGEVLSTPNDVRTSATGSPHRRSRASRR